MAISISPHDTPDAAARDADPETIPLGPQSPSIHQSLAADFGSLDGIHDVVAQQTRRRGRGPIEFVLLRNGTGTTESRLSDDGSVQFSKSDITPIVPDGCLATIRDDPYRAGPAIPSEKHVCGSVVVWRHPLAPHLTRILDASGAVYRYSFSWDGTPSALGYSPGTVQWSTVAPLYVTISGPVDSLDEVMRELTESVVSTIPRPSATLVETYADEDDVPDSAGISRESIREAGVRGFATEFTDREITHSPESGVYNIPAEDVATILNGDHHHEDLTTNPGSLNTGITDPGTANRDASDGVQLTVTSPPYLDVIDYDAFSDADGDWSRKHGASIDDADADASDNELIELWKAQQYEIFEQVFDVTKDGGFCAVVIGHVKLDDGTWVPLPHEFSSVMRDIGWEFHERIIWRKVGNRDSRFGTTIQHPKPTYYYPNQVHEEVMIWRKGDIAREKRPTEELEISELMKQEIANNVWHIPPVPHNKDVEHPCPFPEEIAHRLTTLFSYPGDVVFDPMAGSGTTVKVADRLDRIGIGTELQSTFTAEARRRLRNEQYTRNDQIIPSFDQVVAGDGQAAKLSRRPRHSNGIQQLVSPDGGYEQDTENTGSTEKTDVSEGNKTSTTEKETRDGSEQTNLTGFN